MNGQRRMLDFNDNGDGLYVEPSFIIVCDKGEIRFSSMRQAEEFWAMYRDKPDWESIVSVPLKKRDIDD